MNPTGNTGQDPSSWSRSQQEPLALGSLYSDSNQEVIDINRAITASLERYRHESVLLPGIGAQTAMADEDEDVEEIVRYDLPVDSSKGQKLSPTGGGGGGGGAGGDFSPFSPTHPSSGLVGDPSPGTRLSTPTMAGAQSRTANYPYPFGPTKSPTSIEDRIKDLQMRLAQEVMLLNDADADTLVFITAPPQQPEQGDYEYKEYRNRCVKAHRVHSKKFLALGSAYFNNAFGPTKQHRVQGKRGLRNNLPPGIKYVLDLTPPTEGEDAAYLMTELSCSTGVRLWFQAEKKWDVSKTLVGGYDEFEPHRESDKYQPTVSTRLEPNMPSREHSTAPKTPDIPEKKKTKPKHILNWNGDLPKPPSVAEEDLEIFSVAPTPTPSSGPVSPNTQDPMTPRKGVGWSIPLDYSPVRHRSAIERLLHAIEGLDPKLDSAPKIWTFFAVAKYFDCAKQVADWLIRWMYATPNSFFIELHPEVASRIADGVQCLALYRDAYAILVGEEALDNIRRTRSTGLRSRHVNSYGRAKEDLTEIDQTRVEYGSKSFIDRIYNTFLSLIDGHMIWLLELPEFRTVHNFHSDSIHRMNVRQQLLDALKAYVRGRFLSTLCRRYNGKMDHLKEFSSASGYPNPSYMQVYNSLNLRERLFTRTAWALLNQEDFGFGETNASTDWTMLNSPDTVVPELAQEAKDNFNLKPVNKNYIGALVDDFQNAQLAEKANCEAKARKAAEAATAESLRNAKSALPFRLKMSAEKDGLNETLILPDRTLIRHPQLADSISSLSSFEDLSFTSSVEHEKTGGNVKSRDKRRKLSDTEELLISLADFENGEEPASTSHGGSSQEGTKKLLVLDPTAEVEQEENRSDTEANRQHPFAYQHSNIKNGLPVFTSIDGHQSTADPSLLASTQSLKSTQDNVPGKRSASPEHTTFTHMDGTHQLARDFYIQSFDLGHFFKDVNIYVRCICQQMLAPANQELGYDALNPRLTDTLVCLDEDEYKYLPLWAGGCDDGSGGVFTQGVPSVESGGFSAPGPSVHIGSAASSEDSFDMVEASTSRNTSTMVQDGFSDTLDRNRVYEADSLWGEVMANKEARSEGIASGKGKGKASYVDENEDAQTMVPGSVNLEPSIKYDFGSDIEEEHDKGDVQEDEDPFADANEFDPSKFTDIEDADDDDDMVMV